MSKTDYELSLSRPHGAGLTDQEAWRILQDDVLDTPGFEGLREGDNPAGHGLAGWDKRWEPDEDMVPLSEKHPAVLFTLWAHNEEDEAPLFIYYLAGKSQLALGHLTFDPFDPEKLS